MNIFRILFGKKDAIVPNEAKERELVSPSLRKCNKCNDGHVVMSMYCGEESTICLRHNLCHSCCKQKTELEKELEEQIRGAIKEINVDVFRCPFLFDTVLYLTFKGQRLRIPCRVAQYDIDRGPSCAEFRYILSFKSYHAFYNIEYIHPSSESESMQEKKG